LFFIPPLTRMFYFSGFAFRLAPDDYGLRNQVSPFGHSRITGCYAPPRDISLLRRVLHRLFQSRHPPFALNANHPNTDFSCAVHLCAHTRDELAQRCTAHSIHLSELKERRKPCARTRLPHDETCEYTRRLFAYHGSRPLAFKGRRHEL
jgi:hypothetical protein